MMDMLYEDPELVRFYDAENGWGDDTRFCLRLAEDKRSVLDLGCGTGLLAAALGDGRDVVGVDPAGAILDVARRRDGGSQVRWVEADARTVRLGRRFGLVVMTGHAFQCLLTSADRQALCQTIAAHLEPGGTFIFDSRQPAREEWREWVPELSRRSFDDPVLGAIDAWNDMSHDATTGLVNYETHYRSSGGQTWSATSRIGFAAQEEIASCLVSAGLEVRQWLGDWTGRPWTEAAKEIIPLGTLAAG